MDPVTIMNLSIAALAQVLNLIASIRGQSGLTDDAINAGAQSAAAGNDVLYQQMIAAIKGTTPPVTPDHPGNPPTAGPVA